MLEPVWWEIESGGSRWFQECSPVTFSDGGLRRLPGHEWRRVLIVRSRGDTFHRRTPEGSPRPPVQPRWAPDIYSDVDDLEKTLTQVVRLGGKVERSRTHLGGDDRWLATFTDPYGVSIGLWMGLPGR